MLAEFGIKLPDHARLISTSEVETGEWIDSVSQVLGEPTYKLTPDDPNNLNELVNYYLHLPTDNDSIYPNITGTVLTINRNLGSDSPLFKIDLRIYDQGHKRGAYCLNISNIALDETTNNIYLINANPGETDPHIISVSSLGSIVFFN